MAKSRSTAFSVKNAAMRHLNGWDSARAADSGTRLWRLL